MNLRSPKLKIQYLLQLLKNEIFRCKSNKSSQDVYAENYTILSKETREELNKQRNVSHSWTGRLNIAKMSILSQLIYRSNAILTKIPERFFCRYRQDYSKIYRER